MWHQYPECGPADKRHTAKVKRDDKLVSWVVDQALRCGNCLLVSDDTATTQAREAGKAIAAARPKFLDWMDAGARQIEHQIGTTEAAQIADMVSEGCPHVRREP